MRKLLPIQQASLWPKTLGGILRKTDWRRISKIYFAEKLPVLIGVSLSAHSWVFGGGASIRSKSNSARWSSPQFLQQERGNSSQDPV